jgi:hypothetical protein
MQEPRQRYGSRGLTEPFAQRFIPFQLWSMFVDFLSRFVVGASTAL